MVQNAKGNMKGKSPFYPGQPVPVELFVGRSEQIERIMTRGVEQVASRKPVTMFIQGEYGIGKSSIAGFTQWLAENKHGLHGIYAPLGGCRGLGDLPAAILQAVLRSGAFDPKKSEKVRSWLAHYIGRQELFGLTLNFEALKRMRPILQRLTGYSAFSRKLTSDCRIWESKGYFWFWTKLTELPKIRNLHIL